MKLFGRELVWKTDNIQSNGGISPNWSGNNMVSFDGEVTPYELGTPYDFQVDYYAMRLRAWESFLKTDIIQNAIHKYVLWVVGSGLKLQSDPVAEILKDISEDDLKLFISEVEANFRLYAKSKRSTYSGETNLHAQAAEATKNALISGDVLCILRLKGGNLTTDIIDGCYVQNPTGTDHFKNAENNGNVIVDGVEVDKKGSHVAYYIYDGFMKYTRVSAYGVRSGKRMAWLYYSRKHKINDTRGMSLLSAVLETADKINRYKDATIGSAEENNKIPYTIEHDQFSDGENPMINQLAQSMAKGRGTAPETQTINPDALASKVALSTSKQVYNFPVGAKLKRNNNEVDPQFKDFFLINVDVVYATIGIPGEVALDKFGGSYSSSRAALKSWEYNMMVSRVNLLTDQFYKPVYDLWLDVNILKGNISAQGYLLAMMNKEVNKIEAYKTCRFIGMGVPHIDPLKEVKAERAKLGSEFDTVPLSTAEQSCEILNTGDYNNVIKKAINEKELASSFDESPDDNGDGSGDSVS